MRTNISSEFQKVHDFESLIAFLRDTLRWPIPEGKLEFEGVTFDWAAESLRLSSDAQARIIGCRQLRIFDLIFDLPERHLNQHTDLQSSHQLQLLDSNSLKDQQPWGIFFVEFENNVQIDACRTLLRRVLRGLVGGPKHSASLLFGATTNFSLSALLRIFKILALYASWGRKIALLLMTIFR